MATHKESIDIWLTFYREKTNQNYILDGKQCANLKLLMKKVTIKVIEKGMQATDENVLMSYKAFLYTIKDKWILDRLDISLINSKFNTLYHEAVRSNPFTVSDRISDIVERRNSERTGS